MNRMMDARREENARFKERLERAATAFIAPLMISDGDQVWREEIVAEALAMAFVLLRKLDVYLPEEEK